MDSDSITDNDAREPNGNGIFTYYFIIAALLAILAAFVWGTLEFFGFINVTRFSAPYSLSSITAIFSALGSLLLTFVLVILYDKQASIQDSQRQLMSNQTAIMAEQASLTEKQRKLEELEHVPEVHVSKIQLNESKTNFELVISNHGKGVAKNVEVELQPILDYPETPRGEVHTEQTKWEPYREKTIRQGMPTEGCYIRSDEQDIYLQLGSALYISSNHPFRDDSAPVSFAFATEQLSEMGKEYLRLKFILHFEDTINNQYEEEFADLLLPIKGRTALESAFEYGSTTEGFEKHRLIGPRRQELDADSARNDNIRSVENNDGV